MRPMANKFQREAYRSYRAYVHKNGAKPRAWQDLPGHVQAAHLHIAKCRLSIDYFAEHYCSIINKKGKAVPLKLTPLQKHRLSKLQ